MQNIRTTFGGCQLDAATTINIERLLAEVATLHHVDGDAVWELARAILSVFPRKTGPTARRSETEVEYEWRPPRPDSDAE